MISLEEFNEKGEEHKGRAFGAVSKERQEIIKCLHENGAGTPEEIGQIVGLDTKITKTRLDVMRRDKLVIWKDVDGETYYALTEKGIGRAIGKTEEKPKKKK